MTFQYSSHSALPSFNSNVATTATEQEQKRFTWKNRTQHLFFFLGYTINIRSLSSFIYEDGITNPEYVPSVFQTILLSVIMAGPFVFLQNFIGQFTQRGCIVVGTMLPAMYGFGYCMLLVSILDATQTLYYSGASLLYTFTSMLSFPYPAWMHCTAEMYRSYPNCFALQDIDLCVPCRGNASLPCFTPGTKVLSAKVFRILVAFEKNNSIADLSKIGPPQLKSTYHILFTAFLVYFVSCRRLKSLDWSLRLCLIFCFLGTLVSFVVVFSHIGIVKGSIKFFSLNFGALFELRCWIAAYRRVTEALKISCGGHVLLGSYMPMDTPSHFRICHLMGYFLLVVLLFELHYTLTNAVLSCRLNMPNYGIDSANDISFVMYPTEYGLAATPQLWSTLHFAIYWMMSVVCMVLHVVLVDETLSEEFKIENYYLYTRCVVTTAIFLLTLPMTSKGGTLVSRVLGHELKIINLFVILLTFIILFMYNIQRLKDDIYFVLNVPPTWYIQACWILTAFVTGSLFLFQVWQYQSDNRFYLVRFSLYFIIASPLFVGFAVELVQYIRKRNITGLFRPSINYGSPDLETRLLRLLYNPRLEVRYRRRKESCKHRCMLNNQIVVTAIEKELTLLEHITYDLKKNEEYKGEYSSIIVQLQEHLQVMRIRFSYITKQLQPN